MPIRVEIIGETPGSAALRIVGLGTTAPADGEMRLMRPNGHWYLGGDGQWYKEEKWLPLPMLTADGAALVGVVGPLIVDPLARLGPSDVVGLAVRNGSQLEEGRVKTQRLFVSSLENTGGDAEPSPVSAPPESAPPVIEDAAPEEIQTEAPLTDPPVIETAQTQAPILTARDPLDQNGPGEADRLAAQAALASLHQDKNKSGAGVIVKILGILVVFGLLGLAGAVALGYLNSQDETSSAQEQMDTPALSSLPTTREQVATYLAAPPTVDDALATAQALMEAGHPDLALLVYKHAQKAGSVDAALALARMYDPDTWSEKTSPFSAPDGETATYWYEPAAEAGNVEAQRQLGKILVTLYPDGFQHGMGRTWLEKAAKAGDAEAQKLLDQTK